MGVKVELKILSVKSLREDLCLVQSALNHYPHGDQTSRVRRIGELINQLDEMRPLGSDGKHGNRHTSMCGCEVKGPEPLANWEKELIDGGPWKDLPVVNFSDYEINADGRIRHKETKECVNTEWDKQWQRYCVKLTKPNGDWVKLEGPVVAKELFR